MLHREGTPAEEARRTTELNIERQRIEPVSEVRTAREMAAPDAAAGESSRAEPRDPPAMEVPAIESAEAPAARNDALGSLSEPASLDIAGMPPPLRGSLASLERQDQRLEADGLERIEDEDDLSARIQHHLLVPLPVSDALTVNAELLPHHRYCRPWTARFLTDLARAHEAEFHRPLEVSSAVRPVAYQARLMRINGNAAPAEGDLVSPHVMGATIDIAKKQMSREEIAWMRRHLLALEVAGKIDVEEEFEQACFHITVYRDYVPARPRVPREPETEATGEGTGD